MNPRGDNTSDSLLPPISVENLSHRIRCDSAGCRLGNAAEDDVRQPRRAIWPSERVFHPAEKYLGGKTDRGILDRLQELLHRCGWKLADLDVAEGDGESVVLEEDVAVVGFAEVGVDVKFVLGDDLAESG